MSAPPPDHPGVHFPPPFLYVGVFLIGLGLQRVWPVTPLPRAAALPLSGLFILACAGLAGWAMLEFRRARTSLLPNRPASSLMTSGPFGRTRNPLYLSLLFLYLGAALWLNALWPMVLAVPLVLIVQQFVIVREEHYLERRFGDAYREYKGRVRRWI